MHLSNRDFSSFHVQQTVERENHGKGRAGGNLNQSFEIRVLPAPRRNALHDDRKRTIRLQKAPTEELSPGYAQPIRDQCRPFVRPKHLTETLVYLFLVDFADFGNKASGVTFITRSPTVEILDRTPSLTVCIKPGAFFLVFFAAGLALRFTFLTVDFALPLSFLVGDLTDLALTFDFGGMVDVTNHLIKVQIKPDLVWLNSVARPSTFAADIEQARIEFGKVVDVPEDVTGARP